MKVNCLIFLHRVNQPFQQMCLAFLAEAAKAKPHQIYAAHTFVVWLFGLISLLIT